MKTTSTDKNKNKNNHANISSFLFSASVRIAVGLVFWFSPRRSHSGVLEFELYGSARKCHVEPILYSYEYRSGPSIFRS